MSPSAGSQAFAPACREIALRLGVSKLVWIDRDGGLRATPTAAATPSSTSPSCEALLASGGAGANARRVALLREIEEALDAGIAAVNVCTLEGLRRRALHLRAARARSSRASATSRCAASASTTTTPPTT